LTLFHTTYPRQTYPNDTFTDGDKLLQLHDSYPFVVTRERLAFFLLYLWCVNCTSTHEPLILEHGRTLSKGISNFNSCSSKSNYDYNAHMKDIKCVNLTGCIPSLYIYK